MKRTFIVTLETSGAKAGRELEKAENEFLDHCDSLGNNRRNCFVHVDICPTALAQTLIDDLCNSGYVGH